VSLPSLPQIATVAVLYALASHTNPFTFDFALHASSAGKGVWDGLGGMLKQWLRTRIVSALSYDPNSGDPDPLAACAEPGSDKFGRIDKAHDSYLLLRSHFELGEIGIAWRREQAAKGGAVSSMYFHWAPSTASPPPSSTTWSATATCLCGGPRRELQGQRVRAHWPLLLVDEQDVRPEERQRRRLCGEQAKPRSAAMSLQWAVTSPLAAGSSSSALATKRTTCGWGRL